MKQSRSPDLRLRDRPPDLAIYLVLVGMRTLRLAGVQTMASTGNCQLFGFVELSAERHASNVATCTRRQQSLLR